MKGDAAGAALAALLVAALCVVLVALDAFFFFHDDFQLEYLPASCDIARAYGEGELPLLSPYSWFGSALAAEHQHAVFSLPATLLNILVWKVELSLAHRAALLSTVHLALLAAGAFLLARSYNLARHACAVVTTSAALNGWLLTWGAATWYPALASFAYLPWFWLAARASTRKEPSVLSNVGSALAAYALITAGWPYTDAMLAVLTLWLAAQLVVERRIGALLRLGASVAAGVLLAAPALLTTVEYAAHTLRSGHEGVHWSWTVPGFAWLGLVVPTFKMPWPAFDHYVARSCFELAGSFVPLAWLIAAVARGGPRSLGVTRWELGLAAGVALFASAPMLGVFRWSFRWLPFFHLAFALAAALVHTRSAERESPRPRTLSDMLFDRTSPAVWGLWLVVGTFPVVALIDLAPLRSLGGGALMALFALGWRAVELVAGPRARRVVPAAANVLSVMIAVALLPMPEEVPVWSVDASLTEPAPLDASRRYLSIYAVSGIIGPPGAPPGVSGQSVDLRPGNLPMLSELEAVHGYSPLNPSGLSHLLGMRYHGWTLGKRIRPVLLEDSGPRGVLARMGVDGLLLQADAPALLPRLVQRGWHIIGTLPSGIVLHRETRSARVLSVLRSITWPTEERAVRWFETRSEADRSTVVLDGPPGATRDYGSARLSGLTDERNASTVEVDTTAASAGALVVFARPWFPGFRATLDGQPLDAERADLGLVAVRVPAGRRGTLVVQYRPRSLVVGAGLALAGALALAAWVVIAITRQGKRRRAGSQLH